MLIYRVENQAGEGAFAAGLAHEHDVAKPDHCKGAYAMPSPFAEPRGTPVHDHAATQGFNSDQLFGFRSLTQLKRAFRSKRGRAAMAAHGGHVLVAEVPAEHVLVGTAQVVFGRRYARAVKFLDLNEV
jgi:hypothetical protein